MHNNSNAKAQDVSIEGGLAFSQIVDLDQAETNSIAGSDIQAYTCTSCELILGPHSGEG